VDLTVLPGIDFMPGPDTPTVSNRPTRGNSPETSGNQAPAVPDTIAPAPRAREDGFGPPLFPDDDGSFGPYRILKPLGKGGMGKVFLAEDTRLGRRVALKLCHRASNPDALERFRREARAAASLRHPNLCPVHECNLIDGIPYFTMALIEGPTLDKWVDQRGGLTMREAAILMRKLALAMHFAHQRGVVHRDLKPSNISLERNEPIILDFGLALLPGSGADSRQTQEGTIMGTPAYMSPEQVTGDIAAMGPASDIYSLGAILYEWLTGRPTFEGSPLAVLSQVATSPGPRPPREFVAAIDPRLEAICLKCLAKNPADRWESMGALAGALTEWLKSPEAKGGIAAEPTEVEAASKAPAPANADADATQLTETDTTQRRKRRRAERRRRPQRLWLPLAIWAIVGGALLSAVVVAILLLRPHGRPSSSAPIDVFRHDLPPLPPQGNEALAAAGTVRGYLEEVLSDGRTLVVVTPGSYPQEYAVAPQAEIRIPEPPPLIEDHGQRRKPTADEIATLRGDGIRPGYKATLADIEVGSYIVIDLAKTAPGATLARAIIAQPPPPGYPPPPPPRGDRFPPDR
jgi:hypothetical protein